MKRLMIFCFFVVALFIGGCNKDFLDKTPDEDLTLQDVFTNRNYAQAFLTSIYAGLPWEIDMPDPGGRSPWVGCSDEMEITFPGSYGHVINHGGWNSSNIEDNWQFAYQDIRKCDIFLENIDQLATSVDFSSSDKDHWKGEATFLRAYSEFLVYRLYGPISILNNSVKANEDFTTIRRLPLDSCVAYMIKDCDQAVSLLPITVTTDKTGRATKAAALALKARILLYAASPLFNGNPDFKDFTDNTGTKLMPQTYDAKKWQLAADAAKACIDQSEAAGYGLYYAASGDPVESYSNIFLQNNNKEVLWATNYQVYNHLEMCQSPLSYGGYSIMSVSQDLVDAYQNSEGVDVIKGHYSDGSPIINNESGYTENGFTNAAGKYWDAGVSNMYANREPRFYASIHFSGEQWKGKGIELWYAGKDGASKNPSDFCKTGYLMKKFANPQINIQQNTGWDLKTFIIFRLGEQYLNYAEALNEAAGPVSDVYKYINAIRKRAGLPDLPSGLSKDDMRERIHHERRIELAFESERYFDCRRWKIASTTNNGNLFGLSIYNGNNSQDNSFYQRAVADKRSFISPRDYLWPVPQSEIDRDSSLVQNPGW